MLRSMHVCLRLPLAGEVLEHSGVGSEESFREPFAGDGICGNRTSSSTNNDSDNSRLLLSRCTYLKHLGNGLLVVRAPAATRAAAPTVAVTTAGFCRGGACTWSSVALLLTQRLCRLLLRCCLCHPLLSLLSRQLHFCTAALPQVMPLAKQDRTGR